MEWLVPVMMIVLLLGLYLSWTASRLDRLHWRVDKSRAVLDAELFQVLRAGPDEIDQVVGYWALPSVLTERLEALCQMA